MYRELRAIFEPKRDGVKGLEKSVQTQRINIKILCFQNLLLR